MSLRFGSLPTAGGGGGGSDGGRGGAWGAGAGAVTVASADLARERVVVSVPSVLPTPRERVPRVVVSLCLSVGGERAPDCLSVGGQ